MAQEDDLELDSDGDEAPKPKSRSKLLIIIGVVVLLLGISATATLLITGILSGEQEGSVAHPAFDRAHGASVSEESRKERPQSDRPPARRMADQASVQRQEETLAVCE